MVSCDKTFNVNFNVNGVICFWVTNSSSGRCYLITLAGGILLQALPLCGVFLFSCTQFGVLLMFGFYYELYHYMQCSSLVAYSLEFNVNWVDQRVFLNSQYKEQSSRHAQQFVCLVHMHIVVTQKEKLSFMCVFSVSCPFLRWRMVICSAGRGC